MSGAVEIEFLAGPMDGQRLIVPTDEHHQPPAWLHLSTPRYTPRQALELVNAGAMTWEDDVELIEVRYYRGPSVPPNLPMWLYTLQAPS